jgi:hypothetical protein
MTAPPTPPRRVIAGHGFTWLREALGMVRRWPFVFLPMGLIVGIISLAPYAGFFAILILGPTFLAGMSIAAQTATRGERPAVHQLFTLFAEPRWRNQGLKLCLPLIAGEFIAFMVLVGAVMAAITRAGTTPQAIQGHPEKIAALLEGGAMAGWLVLAVAIVAFAWTVIALAIPRVALARQNGFDAMREGFRSVWRNIGACAVAIIGLFVGLMVLMWLLALTRSLIVIQLGLTTALYAVAGPLLHAAWRDLGDGEAASGEPRDAPPPSAPPPSGVLEA